MSDQKNTMTNKPTDQTKPTTPTTPARPAGRPMHGPGGGPGMLMPGERAHDFKGSMRKLIQYLDKYRWLILVVMLVAAASTVFAIFGPRILGTATTELYQGVMRMIRNDPVGVDFTAIGNILLRVMVMYLISAVLGLVQGVLMVLISADITYRFRKEIAHKINVLPLSFFDHVTQGEVLSRVTNDVDAISTTLNQSLSQIVTSVTSVIGILIMMFTINATMTLIALTIVPLSLVLIRLVVKKSQGYFRQQQQYLGFVNSHVEEMYGGHQVMKAFNGEARSVATFDGLNTTLYSSAWKSQFLSGLMMPVMGFIGNLGYVAVAVMGGWLAVRNLITVGDIQAFIQYVRSFQQPLTQLANISNVLQQTAAAAERVFKFLDEPEEAPDPVGTAAVANTRGAVAFDHVRFGYDPEKIIIHDFTAEACCGQRVAIVGPTGAGKTTIVKLLMRFYDVNAGAIRVDGRDIREMTRADLRDQFGMVLQDTWLYNGTILENIRYGRPGASDEEVIAAAKAAHVDHFVHTLPDGYNMVLNEEASNVSQGQKQYCS